MDEPKAASDKMASVPGETMGSAAIGPYVVRWREYGDASDPLVLLLHGVYAGASGYEWRKLAPLLAGRHRVLVPDLIGFGISDRPDREWTPGVLTRIVGEIISLAVKQDPDVKVVASSLTGAHAVRAAAGRKQPPALTLITPTGLGKAQSAVSGEVGRVLYEIGRLTPLGDALVLGLSSAPSVRWFQRNKTYRDPNALTEAEVTETRRVARLPNAKNAQLAFVTNRLAVRLDAADIRRLAPTVIWGSGQSFVDPSDPQRWREAGARVTVVPDGLPQVESPERTRDLIESA
jgi:pimeloyl-ACP methyl ester carboxylesterase